MSFLSSQFGHPHGIAGRLVGIIMAYENRERNRWAVSVLDLQPSDCVLEVGFGPGVAIHYAAERVTSGRVVGIDDSIEMVRQARKRNAAAIRAGRVELRQGSAAAIPYADATFDTVFAVNSLHHWPDPHANLREARRVLKPGGKIAIVQQAVSAAMEARSEETIEELTAALNAVGFEGVHVVTQAKQRTTVLCVIGTKPNGVHR